MEMEPVVIAVYWVMGRMLAAPVMERAMLSILVSSGAVTAPPFEAEIAVPVPGELLSNLFSTLTSRTLLVPSAFKTTLRKAELTVGSRICGR